MAEQPPTGYNNGPATDHPQSAAHQQQQQASGQHDAAHANQAYYQAFSEQPQSDNAPTALQQQQQAYQAYQPPQPTSGAAPQEHQQTVGTQGQQYYPPPPPGPPPQQQPSQPYAPAAGDASAHPPSASMTGYPPQAFAAPAAQQHSGDAYPGTDAATQPATTAGSNAPYQPPLPPRRKQQDWGADDPSNPIHYTRDPHKLIAYLVPFPKPQLKGVDPATVPDRFLIYTPPPPPLSKPKEGEKEEKLHKLQRKWQEEVREAKTSTAKTASWKGVKSKATKGIDWAMSKTTGSNLDFLNRIPGSSSSGSSGANKNAQPSDHEPSSDGEAETTKKTVGLEEMVLVYPSSIPGTQQQLREEFVSSMLRSKTKAQRDSVIATGLLPVSFAIDVLATLVWPFGGLLEIDSVWLYSSIRGAKTARATTKRLTSSNNNPNGGAGGAGDPAKEAQLRLTFTPSQRLEILRVYLAAECHHRDPKLFPHAGATPPTETQVLEAIGWAPSQTGGETGNGEDEQGEVQETKDDTKKTFAKGAGEWVKWCKAWEKDPVKAAKK